MNTTPITFSQIFRQKLDEGRQIQGIEIPIIQRDYAQGRQTKEISRIRDQFVGALCDALLNPKDHSIKLDFIYGNIEEGKLIPLDGQQRLTTLFLLHWYIAKHENVSPEEYTFLKHFTYKTRFSSQHFCDELVECFPDFEVDKLSFWIKDQNWFSYSWEKDPTIKAMLVMIDKINETFYEYRGLWKILTDTQNPAISFYFLPLEEMGITDSLYIKMNSRGKPLTPFEHFKADFEKTIAEVSSTLHGEFIKKVDVDWVDMLWKYRGDDDVIDDEFMKYYRFVTEMICYQQDIEIVESNFELSNKVYGKESEKAEENLKVLFKSLDKWNELTDIGDFFDSIFTISSVEEEKVFLFAEENTNLFSLCCHNYGISSGNRRKFTLNNSLLFYAVQQYLLCADDVTFEELIVRLRIVRNLVFNSADEIRESRFKALLADTYSIIVNGEILSNTLGYSEIQKKQELQKIEWRSENPDLIKVLNNLEDHTLLQGNIAIIGLESSQNLTLLAENFRSLFDGDIDKIDLSRALLTLGDYSQLVSSRFMLCNSNDSSWRELFSESKKKEFFSRTKEVLYLLLNTDDNNMESRISTLLNDYLSLDQKFKDWRYYMINYPQMRDGKSGFYYWYEDPNHVKENQYEVYMMNTSKSLNGKHWNPFLYILSISEKFKDKVSLEEYGAPLIIIPTNQKLVCKNSHWAIYDIDDTLVEKVEIQQERETDIEDRIEKIEEYLINID